MDAPILYAYHPQTGLPVGQVAADPSPLEPGEWLFPAFATLVAPPSPPDGHFVRFFDGAWSVEAIPQPEPEPEPAPPPVPDITRRQLRLWLVRNGVPLANVEAAIDAMPEPARTEAQIEWQDASVYKLSNPLLIQIGAAVGLSDPETLKQAFRDAALI